MANVNSDKGAKRSVVARAAKARNVVELGTYLGDLVAWDFDSFVHPRSSVRAIFESHGFGGCVGDDDTDVGTALLQAASGSRGVKFGRGVLVQPFVRPRKDTPVSIGIYFTVPVDGEGGDEHSAVARVRVESGKAIALPPEGKSFGGPRAERIANDLADRANEIAMCVINLELSNALVAAGRQCCWAPFRGRGATWFVHSSQAPRFRALLDALEALGGFSPIIQPLDVDGDGRSLKNCERASAGVLESELERLSTDLAKARGVGMRDKTIADRMAECDDVVVRAELYRDLLREKADAFAAAAADIKAQFARARDGHDETLSALASTSAPAASPFVVTDEPESDDGFAV